MEMKHGQIFAMCTTGQRVMGAKGWLTIAPFAMHGFVRNAWTISLAGHWQWRGALRQGFLMGG